MATEAWLLGERAFLELIAGVAVSKNSGIAGWVSKNPSASLYVSEFTWAAVRADAEAQTSPQGRQDWMIKLDKEVPQLFGTRLLPVDRAVLATWSRIAHEAAAIGSTVQESIEVATAIAHSMTYLTDDPKLATILRCPVEDPWA